MAETDPDTQEAPLRTRLQAAVICDGRLLMVQHRQGDESWWCLPGGGWQPGESYAEGALRELEEECRVKGQVISRLAHVVWDSGSGHEAEATVTFLVEIGEQQPGLGFDPEVAPGCEILSDVRWMVLAEIPERDRAFLWASGLLAVKEFYDEVETWGDAVSYPGINVSKPG
jgi:8-oxo-dGTP diphosphatase